MKDDFSEFFGEEEQPAVSAYTDNPEEVYGSENASDADTDSQDYYNTADEPFEAYGEEPQQEEYDAPYDGEDFYPEAGQNDGEIPPEEEEPAPAPKAPKKKRSFKKRVRRFIRRINRLSNKALALFGGIIVILIAIVVIIVVLLSKGCSKSETASTDEQAGQSESGSLLEATPTLPPVTTPDTSASVTPEPTAHPLEGLGTQGTNGWYLKLNDEAPIIADIQERLYELGYMEIPVVDGKEGFTTKYGPSTKSAVKAFQAVNGLDCDGLLGESSYDLLMSDDAKALQFSNSSSDSVFEDYIIKLQTRLISLHYLSGEATGEFETKTQNALKQFQAKNGLTADGIAGTLTLAVLYSTDALDATSSVTATAIPTVTE